MSFFSNGLSTAMVMNDDFFLLNDFNCITGEWYIFSLQNGENWISG